MRLTDQLRLNIKATGITSVVCGAVRSLSLGRTLILQSTDEFLMDLGFSTQQEEFRLRIRDLLSHTDRVAVRDMEASELGYSSALWGEMAKWGWLGLALPKLYGGSGGKIEDLVLLLEELGRHPFPSPFQTAIVQSGFALEELGSDAQKFKYLQPMISGELRFAFALTEESASYEPADLQVRALPRPGGFSLNGTKLFIQYGNSADYYLVVARTEDTDDAESGLSFFVVDSSTAGIGVNRLNSMAGDKQCEIVFNQVEIPSGNLVGSLGQAWPAMRRVLALAAIAQSAEMAGGAMAALDFAVDYSKSRVQFGRPIASFQAIQHDAATMLTKCDAARYAVYEAASKADAGEPFEMAASEAKAICSEAYRDVTARGHQIVGGIGFYEEIDMQLWFRRAKVMEQLLGDADYHREKIAQMMGF
ncbi:acyl-CoA dehydrogenase family protein [Dehalococcoidia bacterium]|nr:acyl-CoA dehydrogenase family protein [Dehalococcoidia bacterium]